MKLTSSLAASLLLPVGQARYVHVQDSGPDDGRLEQRLKVNAFIIREDGNPYIECWEIGDEFTPSEASNRQGLTAQGRKVRIAGAAELSAVSLVTWPGRTPIWPPGPWGLDDVNGEYYCGYGCRPSCSSPQSGGYEVNCYGHATCNFNLRNRRAGQGVIGAESEFDHRLILTPQNGDNWFYFHDARSSSHNYSDILAAEADNPPFTISTVGTNDGQLLTIEFDKFKNKTKLHDGICSSAGIDIPSEDAPGKHTQLDVNLRIQEL